MKATLQKEATRSDSTNSTQQFLTPDVTIVESKDGYVLTAEMPGVSKEGLEVTLEGSELTLVGRKSTDAPTAELLFRESRPADYRRVFELDPSIDAGRITAKVEQGILSLHLPKAERVKPRRIDVTE